MANTPTTIYGFNKPASGDTPWATTANNDIDSIEQEIARQRLPFISPTVGATTTCDLNQTTGARVFVFTVSQATTLAFTNVPSSSFAVRIRLIVTNGAAFTVTWPASVTHLTGGLPSFKTAGVDEVEMVTKDGGTTWYAAIRSPSSLFLTAAKANGIAQIANTGLTTAGANDISVQTTFNSPANDLTALRIVITDTASAAGAKVISATVGGNNKFKVPKEGGLVPQDAALATSATRGFLYLPTCAGTPSGVPVAETGCAAAIYDTTANKIWVYNGAWRGVVVA